MRAARPINEEPIATYLVAATWVVTLIGGAIVAIVNTDALSAGEYFIALALVALATGLLGIGRGIEQYGIQRAGADALRIAHDRGERHRPYDPDTDAAAMLGPVD